MAPRQFSETRDQKPAKYTVYDVNLKMSQFDRFVKKIVQILFKKCSTYSFNVLETTGIMLSQESFNWHPSSRGRKTLPTASPRHMEEIQMDRWTDELGGSPSYVYYKNQTFSRWPQPSSIAAKAQKAIGTSQFAKFWAHVDGGKVCVCVFRGAHFFKKSGIRRARSDSRSISKYKTIGTPVDFLGPPEGVVQRAGSFRFR